MNTKTVYLPDEISTALNILESNGFDAYVVGGAIRDCVMNNPVSDYDITTNATPDEIHTLFDKSIDTGISHGTVTVVINHIHIEITTFRQDGNYTDHRRPDNVSFSKKIEDDLARRDFTVNALAFNPQCGIIDFFGGMEDIERKILKCVGDAEKRFDEDALRMLRLIRFSSKLGCDVDDSTLSALLKKEKLITYVSKERIREEIIKIFTSDFPEKIFIFRKSNIFDFIFQTDFYKKINETTVHNMKNLEKNHIVRFAYIMSELYSDCKEKMQNVLSSLKFSNKEKRDILSIAEFIREYLSYDQKEIDKYTIKKSMAKYSEESILLSFDILKIYTDIQKTEKLFEEIKSNCEPYTVSQLKITGKALIEMGFTGEDTGRCLKYLLELVTKNPTLNTKETLTKEAGKYYEQKCLCKN